MGICLAALGGLKVEHVKGQKNGNPYEFFSFEKSFKNQKEEWESKSIILKPNEMLVAAELLNMAVAKIISASTKKRNDAKTAKAAEIGHETDDGVIADDTPF